jgi:hypothetical protein
MSGFHSKYSFTLLYPSVDLYPKPWSKVPIPEARVFCEAGREWASSFSKPLFLSYDHVRHLTFRAMELIDSVALGRTPSTLRKGACQGRRWLRGCVSRRYVRTGWHAIWLKVCNNSGPT